jgi:four helix bundle protein
MRNEFFFSPTTGISSSFFRLIEKKTMKKDLEDRLIKFSVKSYQLSGKLSKTDYSTILSRQLMRSTSSAALNYGEAQGAETMRDFVHKIGLVIKELRESRVNLKMIKESQVCRDIQSLDLLLQENDELVAIFFTTIKSSRMKLNEKTE